MTYEVTKVNKNRVTMDIVLTDDELSKYNYLTYVLNLCSIPKEVMNKITDMGLIWSNGHLGFMDWNYFEDIYNYVKFNIEGK